MRGRSPTRAVFMPSGGMNSTRAVPESESGGKNVDGKNNYVFMEAKGKGQYVGTILNVFGRSTGWWGEGDDMFFIDGENSRATINGTGMEDYFNNAWDVPEGVQLSVHRLFAAGQSGLDRQPYHVPVPYPRPDLLSEVSARHDRTRPCQRPGGRLHQRSLLVPDRAAPEAVSRCRRSTSGCPTPSGRFRSWRRICQTEKRPLVFPVFAYGFGNRKVVGPSVFSLRSSKICGAGAEIGQRP